LGEVPEHWIVLSLRHVVASINTGSTPPGAEESAFDDEGLKWYTPGDFSEYILLGKSNRSLSREGATMVRLFPKNSVMLVGIGSIGKVALSPETCSCNQQINGIVCGDKINPKYTTYYLKTMQDYLVKCGKYTTLPIINQEETKKLIVCLPPYPEQIDIITFLDRKTAKIDTLIAKINQSIHTLQEYRSALITAAVTGKIDVRESVA